MGVEQVLTRGEFSVPGPLTALGIEPRPPTGHLECSRGRPIYPPPFLSYKTRNYTLLFVDSGKYLVSPDGVPVTVLSHSDLHLMLRTAYSAPA